MKTDAQRAADRIRAWRSDWCLFAKEALGAYLDSDQEAILRSVQNNPRTSVVSGVARGKDFIAAVACLCFMYLTPRWNSKGVLVENTKIAVTAPTGRQVHNICLPEIARLFNAANRRGVDLPGRLVGDDIRTDNREWYLAGFKADDNNHEVWSGFHAVNTMFVITEASGISETIFNAIEGNLQNNSRILLVFNGNTPIGYAADSQRSERWSRFRLSSLTAPNVVEKKIVIPGQVDYPWIVDKLAEWCTPIQETDKDEAEGDFYFEGVLYRPNDLFRVKCLGMFPKVAEDVLVPYEWIELANQRWKLYNETGSVPYGAKTISVDVAGMGRDSSVKCTRINNYVEKFYVHQSAGKADHMHIVGMLANELNSYAGAIAFIDTIGEGAGCFSRLEELGYSNIVSAKFSNGARGLTDATGQYTFANARAYCYWMIRDWLNPKNNNEPCLPPDDLLAEELTTTRWKFNSTGAIQIEAKEEIVKNLRRSPDRADALALNFFPDGFSDYYTTYDDLAGML